MMLETIAYATEAAGDVGTGFAGYSSLIFLVLMVVVFYFMLIRPQKKKEKQAKEMIAGIGVGDSIVTIGGIAGKVTKIRDEEFLIETGMIGNPNQRSTMRIAKWAVRDVTKKADSKNSLDEPEINQPEGDTEPDSKQ